MAKTEKAGLRAFRERLLAGLSGDVLEIGGGTGANLPCYTITPWPRTSASACSRRRAREVTGSCQSSVDTRPWLVRAGVKKAM